MSVKQRIQKGNYRIAKLNATLNQKYTGVSNVLIFPSYGWGTGVDFLVAQSNKVLELREVTNFDRFDQNGNPEYINRQRKDTLIKSLTRKIYWKRFGNSKKRILPNLRYQKIPRYFVRKQSSSEILARI